VHDAELSDIYVDANGKLWRVVGLHGEPTVHLREIESASPETPVAFDHVRSLHAKVHLAMTKAGIFPL